MLDSRFIIGTIVLLSISTTVPAYIAKALYTPKVTQSVKHNVPRVLPAKPKEVKLPIKSWRK